MILGKKCISIKCFLLHVTNKEQIQKGEISMSNLIKGFIQYF